MLKEPKGWVPNNGDCVFCVHDDLQITARIWDFSGNDFMRCMVGNYFAYEHTAEETCAKVRKLIAEVNGGKRSIPDIGESYYYLDNGLRFQPRCNMGKVKDITYITSGNYICDPSIVDALQARIRSLFIHKDDYGSIYGPLTTRYKKIETKYFKTGDNKNETKHN